MYLSSPRAESARAVTGRQCPHSGEGEDLLTRRSKVKKTSPTWEIDRLSEGYKQAVDQNWGIMAKIGFFGQILRFWAQKKGFTS